MSPQPPTPLSNDAVRPSRLWSTVRIIIFLLLFLLLFGPFLAWDIGTALSLGWFRFLQRTIPRISFNFDIAGLAMICVTAIVCLGHHFAANLCHKIAIVSQRSWRWPWRWTCCGLGVVATIFLLGMSLGGIAHQLGWLFSNNEPWHESKSKFGVARITLFEANRSLDLLLEESGGHVAALQREWRNRTNEFAQAWKSKGRLYYEKVRCLLILDAQEKVAGKILILDDPSPAATRWSILYAVGLTTDIHARHDLPKLIERHKGHLLAL